MSPTARTLAFLRRRGHVADVVERYLAAVQRHRDFCGFADVLAFRRAEPGVLAVQATTKAHVSDRLARIRQLPAVAAWLASGNRAEVWGWWKTPAGKWDVHRVALTAADLAGVVLTPRPRRLRSPRQRELFDDSSGA